MKKILGACIGSCVHVAGILNFLNIAKRSGYTTRFSGSALDIDILLKEIDDYKPDIVAVSYRLSPESVMPVFKELEEKIVESGNSNGIELILGTTKPVADIALKTGIFSRIFTGKETLEEVERYLTGEKIRESSRIPPPDSFKEGRG